MNDLIAYIRREWNSLNRLEKALLPVVVTILFVLFTAQALYSAAISGTNVAAPVVPFDTADTYPTHNARYGKGGLVQMQTSSLCRQIPIQRRYTGMMCYAAATDQWRYLKNGTANTNWQRAPIIPVLGVDYFDGRAGASALFATLSGGARSHTYDASQSGANPLPAPWAFKVKLYNGGAVVIPLRYAWSTCPKGLLSGTATTASFTPTIQQNYSAGRSSCVMVQLTYSASAILGAKRYATAGTPIVMNKIGQQGTPGQGVAAGGTVGQMLRKKSTTDYDTEWHTLSTAILWGNITGTLSDQTDLWNALVGKEPANSNIQAHIGSTNNPHSTTANQVLPSQTGNSGKVLGTDGSNTSWVTGGAGGGSPGGTNKNMQYRKDASTFAGTFFRYTAVSATRDGIILPATNKPFTIYNHAKRAIFAILSGGGIVVNGG